MKKARAKSNFLSIEERNQLINNWLVIDKEIISKNNLRVGNKKSQIFTGKDWDNDYRYTFVVDNGNIIWVYAEYKYMTQNDPSNKLFWKDIALSISMWKTDDIEVKKTLLNTLYS